MKNNYAKQFLTGIAMLVLLITNANAQSNNALDFDGSNDFVTSPQGSSLIAGSQNISLSLWVYPRNSVPGFPDFDGFAGLRNNSFMS